MRPSASIIQAFVTPRATQGQGGDTVGPTKPVKVVNTTAEPVPVRDVENPARQPFSGDFNFSIIAGETAAGVDFFSVPAGKRLVIEDTSATANLPPGQTVGGGVGTREPNGILRFRLLTFTLQRSNPALTRDLFVAGELLRMYLEPGETLRFGASRFR